MVTLYFGKRDNKSGREIAKELVRELGIEGELSIAEGKYGKPYFLEYDYIRFNISHTERYITVVVNDENMEIGIDIEEISDSYNKKIVERIFTEKERLAMENSRNKDTAFYKIWTLKEAYLKAKGSGITGEIRNIDTTDKSFLLNALTWLDNDARVVLSIYKLLEVEGGLGNMPQIAEIKVISSGS